MKSSRRLLAILSGIFTVGPEIDQHSRSFKATRVCRYLTVVAIFIVGCGGGTVTSQQPSTSENPQAAIQGKWEFVAASGVNVGSYTLIESNLSQIGAAVSSGTAATAVATFLNDGNGWFVGVPNSVGAVNACGGSGDTISGTVNGSGVTLNLVESGSTA